MGKLGSDTIKSFYHGANIKSENLEKIGAPVIKKLSVKLLKKREQRNKGLALNSLGSAYSLPL
jgi:hypothetical protein